MSLQASLLAYSKLLLQKGFTEEADLIQKMAHYEPVNTPGVPSFWRRNYDYGEGFYYGDMSKKPGIKEWRKEHKNKGPNFPLKKKKKKKKAAMDVERQQEMYMAYVETLSSWQRAAAKYEHLRDKALRENKEEEAKFASTKLEEAQTRIKIINEKLDAFIKQFNEGLAAEEPHRRELLEQADRIVNPKTLIDKFRTALFDKQYEEAKSLYGQMSPEEKEEADTLAKRFYTASKALKGFCKFASPKMETLKKNKKPLSEEEKKKVMEAGAVWHHGPNGEETPAVWKAEVDGKIWYVCNTHRAYQAKSTLDQAIKSYEFIETTAGVK